MFPRTPGRCDPEQGQVPVVDLEAGEQHGRLARHRDVRALDQHQQEDAEIADLADHVDAELDQWVNDEVGHGWTAPALAARQAAMLRRWRL